MYKFGHFIFQRTNNISLADINNENGDSLKNIENIKDSPVPRQKRATFVPRNQLEDSGNAHCKKQLSKQLDSTQTENSLLQINVFR